MIFISLSSILQTRQAYTNAMADLHLDRTKTIKFQNQAKVKKVVADVRYMDTPLSMAN